ncbi:hypothetical protein J3Q64DRAFT_1828696 [Phycomyces blakesleeanus]|uniref:Galactose oxidase n=2 Tax=Phycomyces blakesleeanus TaxID=4837 RepID=A0A162V0G8_PHYB8|nr:hypothetical protein PHYBLDRAFT_139219 [Phycomyces blakesleeanus NRRL 1555(-)]OAD79183.1 hypothetical protein PHYBLDRAFT_139219 [Phycomyces blakesleeanus NRRL 1555(-)]|eukprot:XP_018297223.1 hypothetical protein PHYBLDRAFT_139219 [Phycomyces blakesleeanus NRRL 1555(-)]
MLRLILLSLSIISVSGYTPAGRTSQVCQFVRNAIYCFGGGHNNNGLFTADYPEHLYLDLSKSLELDNFAYDAWKDISISSDGFELEKSCNAASTILPDDRYIIFGGGNCMNYVTLSNNTVVFDAKTQKWTGYNQTAVQQNYEGFGVYLNRTNKALFWGGRSTTGVQNTNINPIFYSFDATNPSVFFTFTTPLGDGMKMPGSGQSVLGPDEKTIYHFGGWEGFSDPAAANFTTYASSFRTISLYNTDTSIWSTVTVVPDIIPSNRTMMTATLLPNSTSFLIYGGVTHLSAAITYPCEDYAYLFDTLSNSWSVANISSENGAGPRFGHSAVLHPNGDLFIIFGVDRSNTNKNDYHILDTSNIQSFTWKTAFTPNSFLESPSTNSTKSTGSGSSTTTGSKSGTTKDGISGGAIAGIVVGCVAAIAIAGILFWFLRRKEADKKDTIYEEVNVSSIKPPLNPTSGIQTENIDIERRINESNILVVDNNKPDIPRIMMEPVKPQGD